MWGWQWWTEKVSSYGVEQVKYKLPHSLVNIKVLAILEELGLKRRCLAKVIQRCEQPVSLMLHHRDSVNHMRTNTFNPLTPTVAIWTQL